MFLDNGNIPQPLNLMNNFFNDTTAPPPVDLGPPLSGLQLHTLTHTHTHNTLGRIPLDERSARRKTPT